MVAVIETSWQDILDGKPLPESPVRRIFREYVEIVANKARTAIPELNGRTEKAVKLVLSGDVSIAPDGQGTVASQSNGNLTYLVGKGISCSCKDHPHAPKKLCAHLLAYHIFTRATALAKQKLEAQAESPRPEPVSPQADPAEAVSTSTAHIPAQFLTEIHGRLFVQYAGLLAMAHEHGLVNLSAHFISVTDTLALAEATAEFADGKTFSECADATPQNVGSTVRAHFARIALTRAKARCLRDALNISVCSVEELET
jgi:hypothetical protein